MKPNIKRGDIFYIESGGQTVGSEQRSARPAIVVSNDMNNQYSATLEIVYLTSRSKNDLPTHVTIRSAKQKSIALCEQITSVSVERLGQYYGHATAQEMQSIDAAIMISLGLCPVSKPRMKGALAV